MQHGVKRVRLSEQARKSKLEKDRARIAHYRALTKKVLDDKKQAVYTVEAFQNTTLLLESNPEFNAVWNFRRNILVSLFGTNTLNIVEALNQDLKMSMEMMKQYPKCYWLWNHRRWCLETLHSKKSADWARELAIASKVLAMDSRNFHGWHYRRYVVGHIEEEAREKAPGSQKAVLEVNLKEFKYTTETINKSTSNFSAWHNRTKLVKKIFQIISETGPESDDIDASLFTSPHTLLQHELNLVKTGMFMDADDTSVWLYMQWLLTDPVFVNGLSKESYKAIIEQQLEGVEELNALEKEDSPTGSENVWCLKTIIFLNSLLGGLCDTSAESKKETSEKSRRLLQLLIELDPLRKGHYFDQLAGKALVIY